MFLYRIVTGKCQFYSLLCGQLRFETNFKFWFSSSSKECLIYLTLYKTGCQRAHKAICVLITQSNSLFSSIAGIRKSFSTTTTGCSSNCEHGSYGAVSVSGTRCHQTDWWKSVWFVPDMSIHPSEFPFQCSGQSFGNCSHLPCWTSPSCSPQLVLRLVCILWISNTEKFWPCFLRSLKLSNLHAHFLFFHSGNVVQLATV